MSRVIDCRGALAVILGVLAFVSSVPKAYAQLDPKLKTPYRLNIVLHFSKHRVLTPVFQKRVEKRLLSLLETTYGKLARVQIQTHSLLQEVLQRGLQSALDTHSTLSDAKTHFVLIDYANGTYRIQTRQEDGATGLSPGPAREAKTRDRFQVPRLAAKLVDQDFALTGTMVESKADESGNGGTALMAIQGSRLGVALDRWLKPGDVFAVCRITKRGTGTRADQLEWTYLRVQQIRDDGKCACEYYQRFRGFGFESGPGVAGYRCLRLTTIRDHLRIHFIPLRGQELPDGGLAAYIGRLGFQDQVAQVAVKEHGRIHIEQKFPGLGFVKIRNRTETLAEFAVPILERNFVPCRISVNLKGNDTAFIRFRYGRWVRGIYEGLNVSADRASRLNGELKKSPEAALVLARKGEKDMARALKRLRNQEKLLVKLAGKVSPRLDMEKGARFLEQLEGRHAKLKQFIQSLETVIKQKPETKRLQAMVKRAQLFAAQGEFGEALELYDDVLKKRPGLKKIAAQRKILREKWQLPGFDDPRTPLGQARRFLKNVWSTPLDTSQLKENLPKARQVAQQCRRRGDSLGLRKILLANSRHGAFLSNRLDVLRRRTPTEDLRAEVVTLRSLATQLDQLHKDVSEALREKR